MKKLTLMMVVWLCAINSAAGAPEQSSSLFAEALSTLSPESTPPSALVQAAYDLLKIDAEIELSYTNRREEVPINDLTCKRKRELARFDKLLLDHAARECLTKSEDEALNYCNIAKNFLGVIGGRIEPLTACSERAGPFSDERADFDTLMKSLSLINKAVRLRQAQQKQ